MGSHRCSISHCPVNVARRGRFLDNWESYRKAGVNIALGTDTYPRDMILQMRNASYFGKVASGNLKSATAAQVFEAATLGGAHSVGRDDIGRLSPGAKADIVIIGLTGNDTLRMGPVRDPIKSLIDCGIGDDVDTVIVDGIVRMEGGEIPGVDFAEAARRRPGRGRAGVEPLAGMGPERPHRGRDEPVFVPAAELSREARRTLDRGASSGSGAPNARRARRIRSRKALAFRGSPCGRAPGMTGSLPS